MAQNAFSKYIKSATDPMVVVTTWDQDPKVALEQLNTQVKYLHYDVSYIRHLRKLLKQVAPTLKHFEYKMAKGDVDSAVHYHGRLARSVHICRDVKRHPAGENYLNHVRNLGENVDNAIGLAQSSFDVGPLKNEIKPSLKMIRTAPNALWRHRMKDVLDSIHAVVNDAKHPDDSADVADMASELHDVDDDTGVNEDVWE